MRKSLWIMLAMLLVAISAPNAHADSISTFDVSGTASATIASGQSCGASCTFSGTLTIDVTHGSVTAVAITFPGLAAFTDLNFQMASGTDCPLMFSTAAGSILMS
jgi:hypothetical protein